MADNVSSHRLMSKLYERSTKPKHDFFCRKSEDCEEGDEKRKF